MAKKTILPEEGAVLSPNAQIGIHS